jgi:transcriptional regulator with XRE-family HTH domain
MAELSAVFPRNMRAERVRRELDQEQFGALIGWSRSTVSDLESGRRKLLADDLALICAALGLTLAELSQGADASVLRALGLGHRRGTERR